MPTANAGRSTSWIAAVLQAALLSVLFCVAALPSVDALTVRRANVVPSPPPTLLTMTTSPLFDLFPDVMSVQWRYLVNDATSGGDALAVTLTVSAGYYAAIGAAPSGMAGPIVACYVPPENASLAVCNNFLGIAGGGVQKQPPQNRLLWSAVEDGVASVEFQVSLSTLQVDNAATTFTRLIAAHGLWDSSTGSPYGHGPNRTVFRVNLFDGTVKPGESMATVPSAPLQVFAAYAIQWQLVGLGTTPSLQGTMTIKGNVYGAIGFAPEGMKGPIVACYCGTNASDARCLDLLGHDYGIEKARQITRVVSAATAPSGDAVITFLTPLNMTDISNAPRRAIFATSAWDTEKNLPYRHDSKGHADRVLNFWTNELVAAAPSPVYVVFPDTYQFQWSISSGAAGDQLIVTLATAAGYYGAIGFSPAGMEGPITSCFVPPTQPENVTCVDLIGQPEGGVALSPRQSHLTLSSSVSGGFASVTFQLPISALNFSFDPRRDAARLIFAYGLWNATSDMPTFHGPNHTALSVNLYTGKWSGTTPPTESPPTTETAAPSATTAPTTETAASGHRNGRRTDSGIVHLQRCRLRIT